jgi:hypothetical protein
VGKALSIVKHPVSDYAAWRTVYEEVQPLRDKHGVSAADVLQDPTNPNEVTVLHWFPSVGNAEAFAADPGLKDAMARAGVTSAPRVEIVVEA